MKLKFFALAAMASALSVLPLSAYTGDEDFPDINKTQIPVLSVNILDFGGIGDGTSSNNEAFRDAVSFLRQRGGGHLTVPAGIWVCESIVLGSNIDLYLKDGSSIVSGSDAASVSADNATNVSVSGNGILEGCISFSNCSKVSVSGISIREGKNSDTASGITFNCCKDVSVSQVSADVSGDAFRIISDEINPDRRADAMSRNFSIDGCTVFRSNAAFKIGEETAGGIEYLSITGCQIFDSSNGIVLSSQRNRGGSVRNICFSDINMKDIDAEAILFNLQSEEEVTFGPSPAFKSVMFNRIICKRAENAGIIRGLPEITINDVTIQDCSFSTRRGLDLSWCRDISLKSVTCNVSEGEPVTTSYLQNYHNTK